MYNIFLVKQEKELIGKKVILRKSKKQNWREWVELRQRSRNFLQPWEPKWPNNFLTKESFTRFINVAETSLKKKTNYNFFIFHKKFIQKMSRDARCRLVSLSWPFCLVSLASLTRTQLDQFRVPF